MLPHRRQHRPKRQRGCKPPISNLPDQFPRQKGMIVLPDQQKFGSILAKDHADSLSTIGNFMHFLSPDDW
jgi:hypothetical protein